MLMVYLGNMNRGRRSGGYTIVETLIFLAISGALFMSAMTALSGRQGRTEFTNAAREFEIELQDMANDVATGYYANPQLNPGYIRCMDVGPTVVVTATSGSDRQGANRDCIFIGKTVQLGISGATDQFNMIPIAGKRLTVPLIGQDTSNFTESTVKPLGLPPVDVSESKRHPQLTFVCTFYSSGPVTPPSTNPCTMGGVTRTDNFTFMTTFVGINASTQNRDSDDTKVDLLIHPPTSVATINGRTTAAIVGEVERYATASSPSNPSPINPVVNPAGGVYICLNSNSSRQYALLRLGGQGSRFATDLKIESGRCE